MRLSDERLAALEKRYTPTVIKPCRVCGGDMGVGSIGGGEPTVWFCNHAFDNGRGPEAWDHYGKSKFVDRRQGGDEEVCALIAEVRALRPCEKALRDLRECTNPFLRFDEREVHRRRIAAKKALDAIDGSTGPMGGVWRCGCCGEMHDDSTTDPSWRWAGDHWQHKCVSTSPQHGHEPARYFGRALEDR